MSSYKAPTGSEAEYEPGSHKRVLRNKLGLKRKLDTDRAEYEALVRAQAHYYRNVVTKNTKITCRLIRKMHRDWLGKIYAWAGEYRSVELEKGGFSWPPSYIVPETMANFERDVLSKHTPCRGKSLEEVCKSVAIVHANFLYIHPFREGNGRLARWLADIMLAQADYPPPAYRFEGRGSKMIRAQYLNAVISGYDQKYDDLARFFLEAARLRADL